MSMIEEAQGSTRDKRLYMYADIVAFEHVDYRQRAAKVQAI